MESRLIDCLVTTTPAADAFSDKAVLSAMLEFEVALADAEAECGIIPHEAADAIRRVAAGGGFDAKALAAAAREVATPSIPFVKALTRRVREADALSARYVHWGATSQDVFDTALVLCLTRALRVIRADQVELLHRLVLLSDEHASTLTLGRTLLQPATPTTFGLKVAGWAGAISRAWQHVESACADASVLQLGGAAGTLAALDDAGAAVQHSMAERLGLACPAAPWHTHRDRLANVVTALASFVGVLGKMAGDVALLMQAEVAEVSERGGGSSTMPHKRNPSGCAIVGAAATRMPGLAASMLASLVQPHERAAGAWHAEAPVLRDAAITTASAVAAARDVIDGLAVFPERMRANLDATRGVIFAERLTFMLAAALGRDEAAALAGDLLAACHASGRSFGDEVRHTPAVAAMLTPEQLAEIDNPATYLGAAETFRTQLIADVRRGLPG